MVINPNAQIGTSSSALGVGTPTNTKLPVKRSPETTGAGSGDDQTVALSTRPGNDTPMGIPEISSSEEADGFTQFARFFILSNPLAAISVQANSRPDSVFELLDGVLG